jgi:hypothetical protein
MKDAGSKHRLNTRSPNNSSPLFPGGAAMLAVALCFLGSRKRRCLKIMLLLAVSIIGLSLCTGCGSSSGPATPTITWATPAAVTYGTVLSAAQLDATASVAGTFVYSPASGTVLTTLGTQTLSVTFTPTDTTDYTTATDSVTLTVNMATPTITWATPAAITYGTALSATQLDATTSVAGTFAYSPASGTVLAAGSQTLSVTFTPTNTTDYGTATSSVTLTVNMATPTITWATPAAVTYGTALSATQLDATASVAGTFVYSPASGTVLTTLGTQTLSVTFTPANTTDYHTATNTVALMVIPTTPTFSPSAGYYGSAQTVTISDSTPAVTIYYTTNGLTPTSSSTIYSGPINVATTETLNASAIASGASVSAEESGVYNILLPTATPAFYPAAGTYKSEQTVTISDTTPGATIYYSISGSTPTAYTGPIKVSVSETLTAIALEPVINFMRMS